MGPTDNRTVPLKYRLEEFSPMSISKNDLKKKKAGKEEKLASLEKQAASGSERAKKKLVKEKRK
jgi:hypothetical protein